MGWAKFDLKGLGSSQNSQAGFQSVAFTSLIEKDRCYFQINSKRGLD
jgi:hypothetical protein